MLFASHSGLYSLYLTLYHSCKTIASIIRLFPAAIADGMLAVLKIIFAALFTFAGWVRSLSDTSFAIWFISGTLLFFLLHIYCTRPCFFPEEKCKIDKLVEEVANNRLEEEIWSRKSDCDSLDNIRVALDTKTEQEARSSSDHWRRQLLRSEKFAGDLQSQLDDLYRNKHRLEEQLNEKRKENEAMKENFQKKLDHLNETVMSVKDLDERKSQLESLLTTEQNVLQTLENENSMLRSTMEVMAKQRQTLIEKHSSAMNEIRRLSIEKDELEDQLTATNQIYRGDRKRIADLNKVTHRLQSSLSNAKGKLTKVGGLLRYEGKTRSNFTTPTRPLSPRHNDE